MGRKFIATYERPQKRPSKGIQRLKLRQLRLIQIMLFTLLNEQILLLGQVKLAFERLEPRDGKLSRVVLRGEWGRKASLLTRCDTNPKKWIFFSK